MAQLQPTLFIGLGSTGLRTLQYLQQFILEEFETWDLPVLQYLCFETIENLQAPVGSPNLRIVPIFLTNHDLDRIKNQIETDQNPKVQGYKEWLPTEILNLGDDFANGAGGFRAAGRLILWDRWDYVWQEVDEAFRKCISPESRDRTKEALVDYLERHDLSPNAADTLIVPGKSIRVVGTLCGGSCSGMFSDLGFMLRDRYPDVQRHLTVSVLARNDATAANAKAAANCYGALSELDFYYQRLDDGTWRQTLADGSTLAGPGYNPYNNVYTVSDTNGRVQLDELSTDEMMAMDLFLDTVGDGRKAKDAALQDVVNLIGTRNNDGYVRRFLTFGLSSVWYPKSKIAGVAACNLAADLCEAWLPSKSNPDRPALQKMGIELRKKLHAKIETQLRLGVAASRTTVQAEVEQIIDQRATGAIADLKVQLRQVFEEDLAKDLEDKVLQIEARRRDLEVSLSDWLGKEILDLFLESERKFADVTLFLQEFRKGLADSRKKLAKSADKRPPHQVSQVLGRILEAMRRAEEDLWTRMVFLKKEAVRSHRRRYIGYLKSEWLKIVDKYVQYSAGLLLDTLLSDTGWRAATSPATTVVETIRQVRELVEDRQKEFSRVGRSEVIHLVFESNEGFEGDVELNKAKIRAGIKSSGVTEEVLWHLDAARRHGKAETKAEFWSRDPRDVVEQLLMNYQKEGLRFLSRNAELVRAVTESTDTLRTLVDAAGPYLVPNKRFIAVPEARDRNFIMGFDEDPAKSTLNAIARRANYNISNRTCHNTGLRHMLFNYRVEYCFAANELAAFDSYQVQLRKHPLHWTHKDPRFFNWRRFERLDEVDTLMECSLLLFPSVFDSVGSNRVLRVESSEGGVEQYVPGNPSDHRKLADSDEAVKFLRLQVEKAVKALPEAQRKDLYAKVSRDLLDARELAVDDEVKKQKQRQYDLLKKFIQLQAKKAPATA